MFLIGEILGTGMVLVVVLAVVLAIGKLPRLRSHPFVVHVVAVTLVWLLAVSIPTVRFGAATAYVVTLLAIWSYRRETKKPPSGWYRLGAVLTAVWLVPWTLAAVLGGDEVNDDELTGLNWAFAAPGLAIWLIGWAVHWTRQGFKTALR